MENFEAKESGFRKIFGQKVFWSRVNGRVKGINAKYEYNVYQNNGILVQFIAFSFSGTSSNLTELSDNFMKTVRFN